MTNKFKAFIYLTAIVAISYWHSPWLLLIGVLITGVICGRDLRRIALRALAATAFFCGILSLGWVILSLREGDIPATGILRFNLRVLLLTMLGQLAATRLDIVSLLDFHPPLQTLAVLIRAQIGVYRRLLVDYRQAVRSRTYRRPGLRGSQRISTSAAVGFLRRAEHEATELTLGLQSRGVFDDQG